MGASCGLSPVLLGLWEGGWEGHHAQRGEKKTYRTYRKPQHPTREPTKWADSDDLRGGHGQRRREERSEKEGRWYD
jgi:hypothetical protein